jgi:hypothetical protein
MNNLTALIPILYMAAQIVSRELVGFIPAASRNLSANAAATGQAIRIPVTPPSENLDITPGTPPPAQGTNFSFVDMMITKNRIARPIVWNGDEEISVGSQLNQLLVNQYAQAMRSLVNEAERDVCLEGALGAAGIGNVYGTPGTTPFTTSLKDLALIKKLQDDLGTPLGDRHLLINTATGAALRTLEKLTNVNQAGDTDMLRRGIIHELMGYAIRESGGFLPISPGTTTSVELSAAAAAGAEVLAVSATSGNLNRGAIIKFGNDYYMVTAAVPASSTSIPVSPKVTKDIADETVGTIVPAFLPNVAFSRDFIYLIARLPAMPKHGDSAKDVIAITDPVSGLSFQAAMYGDYRETRVEIGMAWGVKTVNPRHGYLLLG